MTPVLAVLNELKKHDTQLVASFICDRTFSKQAEAILSQAEVPVKVTAIYSGKLRRYHGVSIAKQLLDIPTLLRNTRDVALVALGFVQSIWHILRFKPDVVFTKGGFVCLPLGLAAALLRVPLVIHDSDAHPGLTNRILSKYATIIATGAPLENYKYPAEKTHYVGIPVDKKFEPVSDAQQRDYKDKLGLPDITTPLVVVTGGGLGAQRINQVVLSIAPSLIEHAAVFHITGARSFNHVNNVAPGVATYMVKSFVAKNMAIVLGAADVIVTRAGATTLSELAALAKPIVIIPNPMLTGGHQLKNANVYEKAKAAVVLQEIDLEKNPLILLHELTALLKDKKERQRLGHALHGFAMPEAATRTAKLIIGAGHKKGKKAK